jgi:hypothetical protein
VTGFDAEQVQARLARSWSAASSRRWTRGNPALGQCSATALVVQAEYGGEILKTRMPFEGGLAWHFYNRVGGVAHDFTAAQFAAPIVYDDQPATVDETLADTTPEQVAALAEAFRATR